MKKLIFIQKDKNLYDRKKIYNENKIQKNKAKRCPIDASSLDVRYKFRRKIQI